MSPAAVDGLDGRVLNFCANNYLGLSNHPRLVQAAHKALDTHGFGLSSVRFICGTQVRPAHCLLHRACMHERAGADEHWPLSQPQDLHKQLEKRISHFHGTADTILYPSCFDANAGLFEALLTAEDAVISDQLNHASIIDGIRLCKARRYRWLHRLHTSTHADAYFGQSSIP